MLTDIESAEPRAGSAADVLEADAPRSSRLLVLGAVLILAFVAVRLFVAEPVVTHGNSMSPTLRDGDALIVEQVSYRRHGPAVGDIVVATAPDTGGQVVKRVVALAGDAVGIEDGVLMRNGSPVQEPYAGVTQMGGYYWGPAVVPAGHVFLLGDNRLESNDSRAYGPVAIADIHGKYLARIWPLSR